MQSFNELTKTIGNLEFALESGNIQTIEAIWENDLLLQSCLGGKIQGLSLPLDTRIRMLQRASELQLTPIIECLWMNPDLKTWHIQQAIRFFESSLVNKQFKQALEYLQKFDFISSWYSNPAAFAFNKENISEVPIWKILESALESKNRQLIQTIWNNQHLQSCLKDQAHGMVPIDVQVRILQMAVEQQWISITNLLLESWRIGPMQPISQTATKPTFNSEFYETIVCFESLLMKKPPDVKGAMGQLRKYPFLSLVYRTDMPYFRGKITTHKIKIWKLFESALISKNKHLIHMIWENNQNLQSDLLDPPGGKITLNVQIRILNLALQQKLTTITETLLTNPNLKNWYDKTQSAPINPVKTQDRQQKSPSPVDLPALTMVITHFKFALESKNIELIQSIWANNPMLQACLAGKIQGFTVPLNMGIQILQHLLSLQLTEISEYLLNHADLKKWYIEQQLNQVNVPKNTQSETNEEVIKKFTSALLDEKYINVNKIITMWADNPVLASWFGSMQMACFGIENNRIQTKDLISCFYAALKKPNNCVYILRCMLKGSIELQQWIRNLPFNNMNFKCILKSKSLYIIKLIWDGNTQLQKAIKNLEYHEAKKLLQIVLKSMLKKSDTLDEARMNFLKEYIQNIDSLMVLTDVVAELPFKPTQVSYIEMMPGYFDEDLMSKEQGSNAMKYDCEYIRAVLKNRLAELPKPSTQELSITLKRVRKPDTSEYHKRQKTTGEYSQAQIPEIYLASKKDEVLYDVGIPQEENTASPEKLVYHGLSETQEISTMLQSGTIFEDLDLEQDELYFAQKNRFKFFSPYDESNEELEVLHQFKL